MAASSVRISNLHKSYGKVQVLKGIDTQLLKAVEVLGK